MKQGTGAGNPLADILFAIAFCKVIAQLRRALSKAGLVVSFQVNGAREYLGLYTGDDTAGDGDVAKLNDVSFADDLAYVIAAYAHQLLESLQLAACIMWRVYEECGLRLNWGRRKLQQYSSG